MTAASNKMTPSFLNFLMQNKSSCMDLYKIIPRAGVICNLWSRVWQGLIGEWRLTHSDRWAVFPFSVPGPCFSPQFRESGDALIVDIFFSDSNKISFRWGKGKGNSVARYKTHIHSSLLLSSRLLTLPGSQFQNLKKPDCILTKRWHHQHASRKPGW